MTLYLEILSNHEPFPFNVDKNNRDMFSSNFRVRAVAPISDFEREVRKILEDAGLVTVTPAASRDVFIGPNATMPTGIGPYVTIINSGGVATHESHNGTKHERPSVQIVVRGEYEAARTRVLAIKRELDGKRGVTVTA